MLSPSLSVQLIPTRKGWCSVRTLQMYYEIFYQDMLSPSLSVQLIPTRIRGLIPHEGGRGKGISMGTLSPSLSVRLIGRYALP